MNNLLIISKIAFYINNPKIVKLFFYLKDYRNLINTSISDFNKLYILYGNHSCTDLKSIRALITHKIRFKPPYIHKFRKYYLPSIIDSAAYNGNLDTIQWLYQNNYWKDQLNNSNFRMLLYNKVFDSKQFGNDFQYDAFDSNYSLTYAAINGHLEIVKFLYHNNSFNNIENAFDLVAENGHLEVLKWFFANFTLNQLNISSLAMDLASQNGHLEVVKWLNLTLTVYNDHLAVIKLLNSTSVESNDPIDFNFYKNSMDTFIIPLKYPIEKAKCTPCAMDLAAKNGHLEVIKWLHHYRTEGCSYRAMNWAANNGHLEVVKWLHENRKEGCTKEAFYWAATSGHLDVIKFIHQNYKEIKCAAFTLTVAASQGKFEVVKWLCQNRSESFNFVDAIYVAKNRGHLEIANWIDKYYSPQSRIINSTYHLFSSVYNFFSNTINSINME